MCGYNSIIPPLFLFSNMSIKSKQTHTSTNGILKYIPCVSIIFLLFIVTPSGVFGQTQISDDVVVLHTSSGNIVIELFRDDAPNTVSNFLNLTKQKFYDGIIFHRIIKDFMIQAGDPNTKNMKKISEWGYGGSNTNVNAEFNKIMHMRGIVSMARNNDPNSANSQFFIVQKDSEFLDEKYTVFGRLATKESFDTLDRIANLEVQPNTNIPINIHAAKILKAYVENKSKISNLLVQQDPARIVNQNKTLQFFYDEDTGMSFKTLPNVIIQHIDKNDPREADFRITQSDKPSSTILIFIKNSTSSLDDFTSETKKSYSQLIDSGQLLIQGEINTQINNKNVFVRDSIGKSKADGYFDLKYRETTFQGDGVFYTITYYDYIANFENDLSNYDQILNSFEIKKTPHAGGGGCLIATAAYGTELSNQVQSLREIRENVLLKTKSGTIFLDNFNSIYYVFSPTVADLERQFPLLKESVKILLTPFLYSVSILDHVDLGSEYRLMMTGFAIVSLNILLYVVIPIFLITKLSSLIQKQYSHNVACLQKSHSNYVIKNRYYYDK